MTEPIYHSRWEQMKQIGKKSFIKGIINGTFTVLLLLIMAKIGEYLTNYHTFWVSLSFWDTTVIKKSFPAELTTLGT